MRFFYNQYFYNDVRNLNLALQCRRSTSQSSIFATAISIGTFEAWTILEIVPFIFLPFSLTSTKFNYSAFKI